MPAFAVARPRATAVPTAAVAAAALLCVGLAQVWLRGLNCDVSWLLTAGERWLGGARLYVDVIETNPPFAVLLTLPALLAAMTGIRAEAAVVTEVVVLAGLTAFASWRLLCRRKGLRPGPLALVAATFAFLVLPGDNFAQREHFALLLSLVPLAALVVLATGLALRSSESTLAGVCAGLVILIKPPFILAFVLPAMWVAWHRRSLAGLTRPALVAVSVALAGALWVVIALPAFARDIVPVLVLAYLPLRESLFDLLSGPIVVLPLGVAAVVAALPRARAPLPKVMLLAMVGFTLAGLWQGKGFMNHALPGFVLGWLALAIALDHWRDAPARPLLVARAAVLLLGLTGWMIFASVGQRHDVVAAVRAVAPPQPTMIALAASLEPGHPSVRQLDGRWVGSAPSLFVAWAGEDRARDRRALADAEAARFVADLKRERPDVVLMDNSMPPGWLARYPHVAQALGEYRIAAGAADVRVLLRRQP